MYHRERRKLTFLLIYSLLQIVQAKSLDITENPQPVPSGDNFENNIIDFDEDYSLKFNKKYGTVPWESNEKFNKDTHRYTLIKEKNTENKLNLSKNNDTEVSTLSNVEESTLLNDYSVIPLELISTTEDALISILESTTEQDLTVIPLSTTKRTVPDIEIKQTVTLPSTQSTETTTEFALNDKIVDESDSSETTTIKREAITNKTEVTTIEVITNVDTTTTTSESLPIPFEYETTTFKTEIVTKDTLVNTTERNPRKLNVDIKNKTEEILKTNTTKVKETIHQDSSESKEDLPSFSELDAQDEKEVSEDYYDGKDVVPTTAPKTDALSVIFGFAGSVVESVVESVAERVVPKSIFDLFKRMQKQNEALEAERLRSREENGGLGQFGRGILKSISSGLSKPLSQLMAGVRDIGSLDTDRGFMTSVASSVSTVATSVVDAFKDHVQAIYPGTVWCGDGHSPTARSSDLGLFFFTDTCCRQHDACKIYIKSGETKYGLTNTGLFTRSHCSCDQKFRECLRKTNSLVSMQIGLTYFNVLGPQCFRKAHPIVKCVRKTRITGQKCEEYELDYTKPKMWQWFDNETF